MTKNDLIDCHDRIKPFIHNTPVLTSKLINNLTGADIYFKCENFQKMGAFKMRGAANAILKLSDEQKNNGVVTHSSGNHAQAISLAAKKIGINADGPLPCDTSFITAFKNKNHDCIVGMYHDALQSGLKAFGFDRGVTVQGGLPVPITTPAHGTAFDIAGKNIANLEPTLQSFKIALTMAENKFKNG